jgi:hypothetical protein
LFCFDIAGVATGNISFMQVTLWPALQLFIERYNNGMAARNTGKARGKNWQCSNPLNQTYFLSNH